MNEYMDELRRRREFLVRQYAAVEQRLQVAQETETSALEVLCAVDVRVRALEVGSHRTRLIFSPFGGDTTKREVRNCEALHDEYVIALEEQEKCQRGAGHARGAVAGLRTLLATTLDQLERLDLELNALREVTVEKSSVVRPSSMSRRLAVCALRFLPVELRLDYEERFQSELFELAQSGTGRWRQVVHSLRVLVRAPSLRWALRRSASPVRRRSW
jgi:hypothetical protein